jgi:hypothetical protein
MSAEHEISENEDEPVKLTEKLREEISENESIESNIQVPEDVVELGQASGVDERQSQESTTVKDQNLEPEKPKNKIKHGRKSSPKGEDKTLSKLHNQLTKHFVMSNKTDVTLRDIQKQLISINKKLDTRHHQIIRDYQIQLREIQRKMNKIDSSVASIRPKRTVNDKRTKHPKRRNKQINTS